MSKNNGASTITPEEAQAVLEQKRMERVQGCLKEIQAILEKHHCALQGNPIFLPDGRVGAEVRIIPAE